MSDVVYQTAQINTPAIGSGTPALADNPARKGWMIQNLGTNALFVRLGNGASTTLFHVVLKAGALADDGTGGSFSQMEGMVYTGEISVAGTSPRFTVTEM